MNKDREIGSFYECDGNVYVVLNHQGTVKKLTKIKWYRILALYFLHAVNKCKHPVQIEKFLLGNNPNDKEIEE